MDPNLSNALQSLDEAGDRTFDLIAALKTASAAEMLIADRHIDLLATHLINAKRAIRDRLNQRTRQGKPDDEDLVLRALIRVRELKRELQDLEERRETAEGDEYGEIAMRITVAMQEQIAVRGYLDDAPIFDPALLDGTSLAPPGTR